MTGIRSTKTINGAWLTEKRVANGSLSRDGCRLVLSQGLPDCLVQQTIWRSKHSRSGMATETSDGDTDVRVAGQCREYRGSFGGSSLTGTAASCGLAAGCLRASALAELGLGQSLQLHTHMDVLGSLREGYSWISPWKAINHS